MPTPSRADVVPTPPPTPPPPRKRPSCAATPPPAPRATTPRSLTRFQAARRAAQTSLARRWRLWRPAFLSFVVVFAVWAAKMRGFYKWVKRTHML